jgi:hypothetical protein
MQRRRAGWWPLVMAAVLLTLSACGPAAPGRSPGPPTHRPAAPASLHRAGPSARGGAAVSAAGIPPVAVIVENAPQARPQSGLDQAAIVWEMLAEGGITRFFCIFTQPVAQIGPVRSTRIYFDQLDRAYGLPFAHAGGNVDALAAIHTWHLQSIDEIYGAGPYFWRSAARQAPHNLYTSTALLAAADKAFGYHSPPLPPLPRGPLPADAQPTAAVQLQYAYNPPAYVYTAGWQWNGGAWLRTVNGQVQVMTDGRPVRAGTVVVLVVPYAPDPDPYTPGSIRMRWHEPGPAWVLRDGRRVAASWVLGSDGLPQVLAGGRPVALGPGPYWYEVVPVAADVSFTPAVAAARQ